MPDIFTLETKIKQMIDELKGLCQTNGLSNQASEEVVITSVFLYKFLNDKFMANLKEFADETGLGSEEILRNEEDELSAFYDSYPQDVAFRYEDTIECLINEVGNDDFYTLFDNALERISDYPQNEEFSIDTADGGRKPLFTRITENVEVSKRNNFAKNIFGIISQDKFDFGEAFKNNFDFYSAIFEYLIKDYKEKENIKWGNCFLRNIDEDSDEVFELRLKVYDKYPDLLEYNVDIISMLKVCQIRTVRILALMLEKQKKRSGETLYRYEKELVSEDAELFNSSYREVVSILLPCVPLNESDLTTIYAWSAQYMSKYALERTCIEILKKANRKYAQNQPEEFMEILKIYMGTGIRLHNEIVLDALKYFPNQYSDYIIDYLCTGLERTMIEDTSGNRDELLLSKELVKGITARCSEESYKKIEYEIIHFISPDAKRILKQRA